VNRSEWATPVVTVIKSTGAIILCGDFKVTLNPILVIDSYSIPSFHELQEKMSGNTLFLKLDLFKVFAHIKMCMKIFQNA